MCNDLIGHGATIRKSLTLTFPTHLDEKLIKHFLRGYFDGDGCINYRPQYGFIPNLIGGYRGISQQFSRLLLQHGSY